MSREEIIQQELKAHPMSKSVAERMAKDPAYAEWIRRTKAVAKPILDDLAKIGFEVESLSALRNPKRSWEPTIPILLHWLPLVNHQDVRESIIRCLSVPWTGNRATAYLIEEFRRTAAETNDYAWTIGNALSIVDVKGFEKEIINLCRNSKYGRARQMIIMGLHRLRNPEAEEVALDLLSDPEVKLHAIIALGKMKSKRALFQLEKLLVDKQAVIRKEARKAITKINRV